MGRTTRAALLGLGLAATAAAQQRSPAFLTVVDAAGKPLVDAAVTCVFTPDGINPWPRDVVTAAADSRGRARCELLVGRIYCAWAIGAADASGAQLATAPTPFVAAGRVLELAANDRREPRRVQVAGHAAWRDAGAVALRWFPVANEDVWHDLPWPTDDVAALPPSPSVRGALALVDAQGELLTTVGVDATATAPRPFAQPIAMTATAKDGEGTPLRGVALAHGVARYGDTLPLFAGWGGGRRWRSIGITDERGELRFHAALTTTVPGRAESLLVFASKLGFDGGVQEVDATGAASFDLRAREPVPVSLLDASDDHAVLIPHGSAMLRSTRGTLLVPRPLAVETRAANRWAVQPSEFGFEVRLLLPSQPLATIVPGHFDETTATANIRLADLQLCDLRVVDAQGGPVACAVGISRSLEGYPVYWDAAAATDLSGRLKLRLPPGPFLVYASTGTAHAMVLAQPGQRELTARLEPIPTMRVRVVDARGEPIANARARMRKGSYGSSSPDEAGKQWDRLAHELAGRCLGTGRSDANGYARVLAFVRADMEVRFEMATDAGASDLILLVPDGETTVTIQ